MGVFSTKNCRPLLVLLLIGVNVQIISAQKLSLRTNILYNITLTPNLGAEMPIDSVWSAGLNIGFNAWDIDKEKNKKWRHILISPNVRKYFGEKRYAFENVRDSLVNDVKGMRDSLVCDFKDMRDSLVYHPRYFELNAIYSHYNVGNTKIPFGLYSAVKDRRLQGDLIALGGKYGYSWILSRDWRLEAEAGIAIGYAWFKEYDCDHCGNYYGKGDRIFLLPQLGINVVYIIN